MTALTRLVSIPRGEDLTTALSEACSGIDGWVQASGTIEAVELRMAGEGVDPTRALRGRFSLASLMGPAGGPWGVTLARATDAGLEVIAGELIRARSDGVTAAVLLSTTAARTEVERAPVPAEAAARPAQQGSKAKGSEPSGWASAALATARAVQAAAEPELEPELPAPGDLVRHFAFGLCEVLMGDDERLKIRDLDGPGRIREIRMDMLDVRGPTDHEGKRLFRLERRG